MPPAQLLVARWLARSHHREEHSDHPSPYRSQRPATRSGSAACCARRTPGSSAVEGNYLDDVDDAGDAPRGDPRQPLRPRPHRVDRHVGGRGAPEGQGGDHRPDARRAQAGLDADAVRRRAGRPGHRQGALPGPGGRVRHRRGPLLRSRRARADRRRVRAAAADDRRPQGARRRRPARARRDRGQEGQPHLRLGVRRQGRHRRRLRRRRRHRRPRRPLPRDRTRRRWRRADRSPPWTRSAASSPPTSRARHRTPTAPSTRSSRAFPSTRSRSSRPTSAAGSATRCRSIPATCSPSSGRSSPSAP